MAGNETRGIAGIEPIDNRIFVLILQHPQEKRGFLATADACCAVLRRAAVIVGLSWPNLASALGRPADAKRWGVLYLGSARPAALGSEQEVIVLDPGEDAGSGIATYGYSTAALLVHILKQCGDDLTRANIMKQATNITGYVADLALPGMTTSTVSDDWRINKQFQMMRFDGQRWVLFGQRHKFALAGRTSGSSRFAVQHQREQTVSFGFVRQKLDEGAADRDGFARETVVRRACVHRCFPSGGVSRVDRIEHK